MGIIALAGGCRCDAPVTPIIPAPPHYSGFEDLVDAAAIGDVAAAKAAARDMRTDGDGMEGLGGALGYAQIAMDRAEIADGAAAVAAACGRCHAERRVATLEPRPAFTHATAARWAAWGLVWNDAIDPAPGDDEPTTQMIAAWHATTPVDTDTPAIEQPLARLLGACAACHDGKSPALTRPAGG